MRDPSRWLQWVKMNASHWPNQSRQALAKICQYASKFILEMKVDNKREKVLHDKAQRSAKREMREDIPQLTKIASIKAMQRAVWS